MPSTRSHTAFYVLEGEAVVIIALAHHKRRPVTGSKPIGVRAAAVITFDRAGKVATARLDVDVPTIVGQVDPGRLPESARTRAPVTSPPAGAAVITAAGTATEAANLADDDASWARLDAHDPAGVLAATAPGYVYDDFAGPARPRHPRVAVREQHRVAEVRCSGSRSRCREHCAFARGTRRSCRSVEPWYGPAMKLCWVLPALIVAACGASSPAPAPAAAAPTAAPGAVTQAPATASPPAAQPVPAPALPEAPPPSPPGAPRPHVAKALSYIPARAKFVIGLDVAATARTPVGDKLRAAFAGPDIPAACQTLTVADFGHVVFGALGDGGVVVVLDGKLGERALISCAEAAAKAHGGKLESKTIRGRKAWHISGSAQDNGWLVWLPGGGLVLANSEPALTEALDPKAAKVGGDLAQLVAQVDQSRMIWAAGVVPADVIPNLGLPPGVVTGAVSLRAAIDLASATGLDVVLGFSTADEALRVADVLRQLVAKLRSSPDSAPFVADVRLGVYDRSLHVMARLDADATHKLIDAVHTK